MRICIKCKSDGPFYRSSKSRDGLDYYCKRCRNASLLSNKTPAGKTRHKITEKLARLRGERTRYPRNRSPWAVGEIERLTRELERIKLVCAREAAERRTAKNAARLKCPKCSSFRIALKNSVVFDYVLKTFECCCGHVWTEAW